MPSAAFVSPTKDSDKENRCDDTYMDFLIGIQNLFDDINISSLKKSKANDIYDILLSYQLTPFDRRSGGPQILSCIKK